MSWKYKGSSLTRKTLTSLTLKELPFWLYCPIFISLRGRTKRASSATYSRGYSKFNMFYIKMTNATFSCGSKASIYEWFFHLCVLYCLTKERFADAAFIYILSSIYFKINNKENIAIEWYSITYRGSQTNFCNFLCCTCIN